MESFECVAARDTEHALELLAEHGAGARVLAGGTDLLPEIKTGMRSTRRLIDISRIERLKRIELTRDSLVIGTLVTHAEIGFTVAANPSAATVKVNEDGTATLITRRSRSISSRATIPPARSARRAWASRRPCRQPLRF